MILDYSGIVRMSYEELREAGVDLTLTLRMH
jgi:hypothetical protein